MGIGVFDPTKGGDPLLFQHLFWFYSHPAVYIMILPGMGVISEVISTFSRKRVFGYTAVAFSSVAIALFGFFVWEHHMFIMGVSNYSALVFSLLTMLVAVPSAIKIFNWAFTLQQGSITFETPMLYAFGFLGLFTIGGMTGVFLGALGMDIHLTETYFIVAHFHFVMVGGMLMAFLAGVHFWWPKMTGRMYPESLSKLAAVTTFIGFNLTFLPQFILGYLGMPRPVVQPDAEVGQPVGAAAVKSDRDVKALALLPKRIICGVVPGPLVDDTRQQEDCLEAQFLDRAASLRHRAFNIMRSQQCGADQPFAVERAEIVQPVVVGAGDRGGELRVDALLPGGLGAVDAQHEQPARRKQDRDVDALFVHRVELRDVVVAALVGQGVIVFLRHHVLRQDPAPSFGSIRRIHAADIHPRVARHDVGANRRDRLVSRIDVALPQIVGLDQMHIRVHHLVALMCHEHYLE